MQFSKYAYSGRGGASASRPKPAPTRGNARWEQIDNDALAIILSHFDDRALARLAVLDRRTRRLVRTAIQLYLRLGDSQYEVFRAVLERRESVLLMGAPGSGKSFLLRILKERLPNPLVTASTGAAAEKINAWTLHSSLGLGIGDKPAAQVVKKQREIYSKLGHAPACVGCGALIIDEVSMLTGNLLDLALEVMLMMRERRLPQMVVSGDPMQLGAVGIDKGESPFYESELIKRLKPFVLTESFRQAENSQFLRILNSARLGRAREADVAWLQSMFATEAKADAPRLFCHLHQTATYNTSQLNALPLEGLHIYRPVCTGTVRPAKSYPGTTGISPTVAGHDLLHLKPGARVLLNRNLPEYPDLHNGSCGTVVSLTATSVLVCFDANSTAVRIKPVTQEYEQDGKVVGTRTYIPLMLAWAVSIHRAQGATLDSVAVNLRGCWAAGQAYVALSRVREPQCACVEGLDLGKLNNIDKAALRFYNECARRSEARSERHRLRERARELQEEVRAAEKELADDASLNAMMDAFEAGLPHGAYGSF